MYAVQQITGKGFGLIARQRIPRGQRILTDNVLLSISGANGDILQNAYALSLQARAALLGLSMNATKYSSFLRWAETLWSSRWSPRSISDNHRLVNVFRNNNFDIGEGLRAVFPEAARINHACVPNAQGNFNKSLNVFTVHATHDVQPDEEITISYLEDQLGLRSWRQSVLLDRYGFGCACAACQASPARDVQESKRSRLREDLRMFAEKTASGSAIEPDEELEMMTKMLDLYEEEGIRGREAASLYVAAAQKAHSIGKQGTARDLAIKGLLLEREAVGTDSPWYQTTTKLLADIGHGGG